MNFIVSAATTAIKNEKALYTFNPKTISNDQISKWVKTGNLEQLEIATLMGKGKQLLGKTSWNDATRNYIKNVQNVMDDLDAVFKCVAAGDVAKLKTLLEKNIKYVFARDNQGRSPLQVAAQNGQKEVTQCIIAENAEYTQITDPVSNDTKRTLGQKLTFCHLWMLKNVWILVPKIPNFKDLQFDFFYF